MKILIINASPRRGGNIHQMLTAMEEEALALHHEVRMLRTDEMKVAPCKGCMACRKKLECVLPEDDAQHTLQQICWCDVLIVGAPCYWGNIPGQLKLLFDRIVYGMMGENRWGIPLPLHKGKRAIVVTTSTTRWPFNIWFHQTRGVVRALREIFHYSGFRLIKSIQLGGTKGRQALNERTLAACRRAIRRL